MRANHANRPKTDPSGRRRPGRLSGGLTLAAGGAVLANVWGLGLGLTDAYAVGEPEAGLVCEAGTSGLVDSLTGAAAPVLEHPARPVEAVLQEQIRAGGLPLPGQATAVPDAFAIAAALLPTVPAQTREESAAHASRAGAAHTESRPVAGTTAAPDQSPTAEGTVSGPVPARLPALVGESGESAESAELRTADGVSADNGLGLTAASSAPVHPEATDTAMAVLVPIAAGLLLTGAAMYKHRGLPGGH